MLKAIKIRLYPNKFQETQIGKLLGCYRFVYNQCLWLKKQHYQESKTALGLKELGNYFHNHMTKNPDWDWLQEQNTKVLKQSILNLMEAHKRFFEGKGKVGYPRFKSKSDAKLSCRFPLEAISKRNDYDRNRLSLANIKGIRFKTSDRYKTYLSKHKSNIKSATLTKAKSGHYWLSILVDGDIERKLPKSSKTVGIDLGIKTFVVTSDGQAFENLHLHKKEEQKIKRLQRQLSRKQKGSNNRNKARLRLAKVHQTITHKKLNYLHHISNTLLHENQVVAMEDLNISGMMKNHNLAKSIQELSCYELRRQLEYKSQWYQRELVIVGRWYPSSKLCSGCGRKNEKLTLSQRHWVCSCCGTNHDRDINAAVNIKVEGMRIIGHRMPEYTLVDNPTMDDPIREDVLKSSGWKKQEDGDYNFL